MAPEEISLRDYIEIRLKLLEQLIDARFDAMDKATNLVASKHVFIIGIGVTLLSVVLSIAVSIILRFI